MSWFDASGFANLAKSALKEAQKTIDRALDIKEDEARAQQIHTPATDDVNFFATWGIESTGAVKDDSSKDTLQNVRKQDAPGIWGSFTGSFFENKRADDKALRNMERSQSFAATSEEQESPDAGTRQLISSASVPEDLRSKDNDTHILRQGQVSSAKQMRGVSLDSNNSDFTLKTTRKSDADDVEREISGVVCDESEKNDSVESQRASSRRIRREEKRELEPSNADINRVSIVSSESDKKSSESVEILDSDSSSNNTDCTTTPESDITSASISTSATPVDTKRNSESVEILADSSVSVTSPSCIDIRRDSKTDSVSPFPSPINPEQSPLTDADDDKLFISDDSSSVSPYASPTEEKIQSSKISTPVEIIDERTIDRISGNLPAFLLLANSATTGTEIDKTSPESVEVIPDVDETDEMSQAEDSYTSASESTIMTIMEASFHQADQANKTRLESFSDKNITGGNVNTGLDSLKEKHNLHLPIEPITTQPIHKGEYLVERMSRLSESSTSDQIKDSTIEPPDEEAPMIENSEKRITAQQSDLSECPEQYMMLTDSSCEGTLIESSSEDNMTVIKNINESQVSESTLTSSAYVKNMLADAMVEKGEIHLNPVTDRHRADVPARENSPISSESRSDMVKIGSDQTSGHTSGDELETTTSSDIEIISRYSPNGDSSSTQSRQSPANLHSSKGGDLLSRALKTRGHSRELSEISVGSDENNFEIEKLLKRIQEITEILEVRESKLIDVSRINMELHEHNIHLRKQLDAIEMRAEQSQDLHRITDDYTQRLSALEKKFQQAIGERDTLREQLEEIKHEAAGRLSSREILTINAEKDDIIRELRAEGEKLSKQQLQHSNVIKKLRIKEKDNEALLKSQKEQLEEQSSELERLKRSLYAKEEVERSQIEAVHTLTARLKKQETEIHSLQEKLDNALHKMDAYKTSLDATKADSAEVKSKLAIAEEELKQALENAGESCQLSAQVEDLKLKLRKSEEAHVKSVEALKAENNELLKRFEAAEARAEDLAESVTLATTPLLRQQEQLQANFALKANNFAKQEKHMSDTIAELQAKLENLVATDRSLVEENLSMRNRVSALESQIKRKETEKSHVEELLEKLRTEHEKLEEENARNRKIIETLEKTHADKVKELKREIQSLMDKLSMERAAADAEKRKNNAIVEQQRSIDEELRSSPTLSIGRDSIGSTSSVWPAFNESLFESGSGRFPSVYDSLRVGGNSTSMIENLQAQVKQRDGEIQQLQWEISRRNNERDALNMELSTLTLKIEELSNKVTEVEALNENLNDIGTKYDALLQMYGEKVEEAEELRLDLEDVKDMYKTQIDQLLKRAG